MADYDKDHDKPRQTPVLTTKPAGMGTSPMDDVPHQVRIHGASSAPHAGDASSHLGVQAQASPHGSTDQGGVTGHADDQDAHSGSNEIVELVKEQGLSLLERQKETALEQVNAVAHAIRASSDQLRQQGNPQVGQLMGLAAEQLEVLGSQLRNRDIETLLRDTERLARSSPTAFFVGSVAVGFVLARFLKSSSERRHDAYQAGMSHFDSSARHKVDTSPLKQGSAFGENESMSARSSPITGGSYEPL